MAGDGVVVALVDGWADEVFGHGVVVDCADVVRFEVGEAEVLESACFV